MSWQAVGQIAGAVIGSFGGPVGMAIGSTIGGMIGSTFDTLPTQYGPRLDDLRPQTSEYGKPIPLAYGTIGMGGNVIWASDYVEVETETEQGGKGGPSQTSVTYSYYANFAVAFAEGPNTIGRMWAGPSKRLIYDGVLLEGGGTVRIYEGTEDQLPDPLIESYEGVGNVPAHRGVTYVVFEMFPLDQDGNAIPFITAEVGAKAGAHGQTPTYLGEITPVGSGAEVKAVVDPATGWIWHVSNESLTDEYTVTVINDATAEVIATFVQPMPYSASGTAGITVDPASGKVLVVIAPWILSERRAWVEEFSAGVANPDGSVNQAPMYLSGSAWGAPSVDIDANEIGVAGSNVWIGYAQTNAVVAHFAVFPNGDAGNSVSLAPGYQIGLVRQIIGGERYVAAAGSLGGTTNPNVLIFDQAGSAPTLLYALQVDGLDVQGKILDYDPQRERFIGYHVNNMAWFEIDPSTGTVTRHELTLAPGDTEPAPTQRAVAIAYSSKTDRYLIGSSSNLAGTGTTLYVVNPDSFATEGTYTFEAGGTLVNPLLDPAADVKGPPYVLSFDRGNVKRLFLGGAVVATPMNLGAIVADLSARAGLSAAQVDVSALTDMVDGYAVARQTTVRAAIDALRPAYYFDAVESGGKVKFVKRGGSAAAVIDDNDLDAHQADGQPGDPLLTTRQMEVELPKTCNVNYLLAATDYEKATQTYSRQIGSSEEETTLDLPLVLTDTKGQEVAQVNTHAAWVQRIKYGPFTLPRKYSALEPTDIITIRGYEMMLEKVTASPGGVLTCEAMATDSSHYTPHVVVTETVPTEKLVYIPGETTLELM